MTYGERLASKRNKKGYTQEQVAEQLGISRSTYIAVEQNERELTLDEFEILSSLLSMSYEELFQEMPPREDVYRDMISYILSLDECIPKTKLAKLLYLSDFSWYFSHLKSMSGMSYRKISFGPVADQYFRIIDEMFEEGEIDINEVEMKTVGQKAFLISITDSGKKRTTSSLLSCEQEQLIKAIVIKWKDKRTQDIVNFTHKQLPYRLAEDNSIISYEVFTQENKEDIY